MKQHDFGDVLKKGSPLGVKGFLHTTGIQILT
jgi:hypothetical protein